MVVVQESMEGGEDTAEPWDGDLEALIEADGDFTVDGGEIGGLVVFTGVLGQVSVLGKELFWEELNAIGWKWEVRGDFNVVRWPSEKSRGGRRSISMEEFLEFIEGNTLIDLPLIGSRLTWSSMQMRLIHTKIDRFLISRDLEELCPNVAQSAMTRVTLDHTPLLLDGRAISFRKGYFKFENWWLEEEGFLDMVKGWWQEQRFQGLPSFVLDQKLKGLKIYFKEWSRNLGEENSRIKRELLGAIAELDEKEEFEGELAVEDKVRRASLKGDFKLLAKKEELSWRQKFREKRGMITRGIFTGWRAITKGEIQLRVLR